MTMNNLQIAKAFISVLTGNADSICDFRVIKENDPRNLRGTIEQLYNTLTEYNTLGYGIFINISEMTDRSTKTYEDVKTIRCLVADIDNLLISEQSYEQAVKSTHPPHFAVQTSPGKYHLYWLTDFHDDVDFFRNHQRKLVVKYQGDKSIIDPTRVLRVPGFYHTKGEPVLVNCWQVRPDWTRYTLADMTNYLQDIDTFNSTFARNELGKPELQAPSLEWLTFALNLIDPNELDYDNWLSTSAAFKQAGWSHTDEQTLKNIWLEWCAKYNENNQSENEVKWKSFNDTQVGWSRFKYMTNINAYMSFSGQQQQVQTVQQPQTTPAVPAPPSEVEFDSILDATGKKSYFKNCFFVESEGRIFTPSGRFMNANQFNGAYGGKEFCLRAAGGKLTDEPWKAALRSTDYKIETVDHCRFLPDVDSFKVLTDSMGRKGLNTYLPSKINMVQGDITLWSIFLSKIFNTTGDVQLFNDYLAHCIKYPGHKIPWSVLLQSAKGIGKQMIGSVVKYCIGENYTYQPEPEELGKGSSKFNSWMLNKIMILVDEVRVGDRYDLMNGLKAIITDKRIAIEAKGVDQKMEDNVANWLFFSNYKDAFPIDENERRYCIFFSPLQTAIDIENAGLDKNFFDTMYHWLEMEQGYEKLAYYYKNFNIDKGSLPHRAPQTSSYNEVIKIGRSPARVILDECIEAGTRGFRGGFVSLTAYQKVIADTSSMRAKPAEHILKGIIEGLGYVELGKTATPISGEDLTKPSIVFGLRGLKVEDYERCQG